MINGTEGCQHCIPRLGFWLTDDKMAKIKFDEFIHDTRGLLKCERIFLDPVESSESSSAQVGYDFVLHKFTAVLADAERGSRKAQQWVARLESVISHGKRSRDVHVLDPIDAVRSIISRRRQSEAAISVACKNPDLPLLALPFVELTTDLPSAPSAMITAQAVLPPPPWISKPSIAAGEASHEMALIFSPDALAEIERPCVIQPFVDHNSLLFKLYVVGEEFALSQRPSIRNLCNATGLPGRLLRFNSHDVSKAGSSSHLTNAGEQSLYSEPLQVLDRRILSRIVGAFREELGLNLFGLDLILDVNTGHFAVIDINPFPAYDGIGKFHIWLRELILKMWRRQKNENVS